MILAFSPGFNRPSSAITSLVVSTLCVVFATGWHQEVKASEADYELPQSCIPFSTRPKNSDWQQLSCDRTEELKNQAVVLFHGLGNCPWEMRDIAVRLCEQGYDVEVPRSPGHGTVAANLASMSRHAFMSPLRADVRSAYHRFGGRPLILGGASLGGLAAYVIAAQMPSHVKAYLGFAPSIAGAPGNEIFAHTMCNTGTESIVSNDGNFQLAGGPSTHPELRFWYPRVPVSFICNVLLPIAYHAQRESTVVNQQKFLVTTEADEFVDGAGTAEILARNDRELLTTVSFPDDVCDDDNGCVRHQLAPNGRANPKWDFMMERVTQFLQGL